MTDWGIYGPDRSLALSSSAGSGKTHALTTRLISLLLNGARPGEILAITFTKRAANEIRQRLFDRITALEKRDDDEIRMFSPITSMEPDVLVERAGEIKRLLIRRFSFIHISTIHAFFGRIVRAFPGKTGLMDCTVLEEGGGRDVLLRDAMENFFEDLERDGRFFERVVHFMEHYKERKLDAAGTLADIYGTLRSVSDSVVLNPETFAYDGDFREADRRLRSEAMRKKAAGLEGMLEKSEKVSIAKFRETVREFVETGRPSILVEARQFADFGEKGLKNYLQKFYRDLPAVDADRFMDLFVEIRSALENYQTAAMRSSMELWNEIYTRIERHYSLLKKRMHAVDFHDMERTACSLIKEMESLDTLFFRLGGTITHVLIDEFQDTSVLQWEGLRPIAVSCLGSGGTVFYVGDRKQSIYRWRGGEPGLFNAVRRELGIGEARLPHSYRQNGILLAFVNEVFESIGNTLGPGYVYNPQSLPADAAGRAKRGYVFLEGTESREASLDALASRVEEMGRSGVGYEDMAVLCRTNAEIAMVEHVLRAKGIPLSTAGRMELLKDYAVSDVVNLLRFIIEPNELYLTALLRSPLYRRSIRWSGIEKALGGNGNGGRRLNDLLKSGPEREYVIDAEEILKAARYETPGGVVRKLFGLLDVFHHYPGSEEALLQFYDLAHGFPVPLDPGGAATLGDFIDYLDREKESILLKASAPSGVTVQTIHSSKGIEYHTVFVPFLSQPVKPQMRGSLIFSTDDEGRVDGWFIRKNRYLEYYTDREAAERMVEDYNLKYRIDEVNALYVAMTRARENLVLLPSGSRGENIGDLLMDACSPGRGRGRGRSCERGELLRIERGAPVKSGKKEERVHSSYRYVKRRKEVPVRTGKEQEAGPVKDTGPEVRKRRAGLLRGLLFHRVMQNAETIPLNKGELDSALLYAAGMEMAGYTARELDEAMAEARSILLDVMGDERLRMYFGGNTSAEFGLVSKQYENLIGRIDRISWGERVNVIDFKTDRIKDPGDLARHVKTYTKQIVSYCTAIAGISGLPIRGSLYFTDASYDDRFVCVYGENCHHPT